MEAKCIPQSQGGFLVVVVLVMKNKRPMFFVVKKWQHKDNTQRKGKRTWQQCILEDKPDVSVFCGGQGFLPIIARCCDEVAHQNSAGRGDWRGQAGGGWSSLADHQYTTKFVLLFPTEARRAESNWKENPSLISFSSILYMVLSLKIWGANQGGMSCLKTSWSYFVF